MHHHVVNLDVAALVGPSVRAADGQPVAVSAEGEGRAGPGIVQHDVLPHDVPVAGAVVVRTPERRPRGRRRRRSRRSPRWNRRSAPGTLLVTSSVARVWPRGSS